MTAKIGKYFLVAALAAACSGREPFVVPEGVYGQEQMTAALVDLHLLEGARAGDQILGDTVGTPAYYARMYARHGTNQPEFKSSLDFYTAHPEQFMKIMDEVIVRLSKLQAEVDNDSQVEEGNQEERVSN